MFQAFKTHPMEHSNRRDFLKLLAGLTSGLLIPINGKAFQGSGNRKDKLGEVLPQRKLGGTGEMVTMLGLGGYHIGWTTEKKAQETIEAAIEGGIRFFDTAESYSDGGSEIRYGKYLIPKYRDNIFLMTKTVARDAKTAEKDLEESLRRLKTSTIDLWQIHALSSEKDVEKRIENGVQEVVLKAKKSGKVRYVGFTGHHSPYAHKRILDVNGHNIFDACQFPVNVVDASVQDSFIKQIMPMAVDRNMGILAMKTLADGRFFSKKIQSDQKIWDTDNPVIPERLTIEEALQFAWSLPISVLITGAENPQLLKEKINLAKRFEQLTTEKRDQLIDKVMDMANKEDVEYYKDV